MKLKRFLPFDSYALITSLSVEEAKERLAGTITPRKRFRSWSFPKSSGNSYEGELSEDSFTISRIINYRNSFLPVISGRIKTSQGMTIIHVRSRPATFVVVFISLWLGFVGLFCLGIIAAGLIHFKEVLQNGFSPILLLPFGMFIFGCVLTTVAFTAENKKTKRHLAELLKAQP